MKQELQGLKKQEEANGTATLVRHTGFAFVQRLA